MLENLLSKNEGKTLEFKESTETLKGIIKTVVTFANTAGGSIVIGITDKAKRKLAEMADISPTVIQAMRSYFTG